MTRASGARVRRVTARGGVEIPALGLGTWEMGVDPARRAREVAALRLGLDLGMDLIDTAEMYAQGGAEKVVGEAIRGRRDEVFLISKVLPENASYGGTLQACEASLKRLGCERLDLYLLHWIGEHPVAETLQAFDKLKRDGKIADYGVSNFDLAAMRECEAAPLGRQVIANQLLYNLAHRRIDHRLREWCREREIAVIAYSPLHQMRLERHGALERVAARHGVAPEAIAIAWTLRHPGVVSIPKASRPAHLEANRAAADLSLSADDLADLDRDYPPPTGESGIDRL